MATKIITKNSSTASAAPLAADLSAGELAINTNDGKLFYKDSGGTVRTLASKDAAAGIFATLSTSSNATVGGTLGVTGATTLSSTLAVTGTTTLTGAATLTANPTFSGGTANGVLYLNGSKVATSGSALTFDGTNFATTGTASASKLIPTGGTATGNGLYLPAANTLGFSTNSTQGMTLDANSVLSVLNAVESTGAVQTNSANKIAMSLEAVSTGRIAVFGADTSTFGTLVFSRAKSNGGTTESARIDFSGNLLVGTTSSDARLNIKGSGSTSSTWSLIVRNSASGDIVKTRDDGYVYLPSTYNNTSASAANIFMGGSGELYRSTSSLKYKTNVQDAEHGLADLLKLRSVTYEGKSENDAGKTFGGLIAEEVDAVGLTEFVQYAEDGTPDALAYGNMVSLCIKAIQEQQAIIEQLKADVAALKGA